MKKVTPEKDSEVVIGTMIYEARYSFRTAFQNLMKIFIDLYI